MKKSLRVMAYCVPHVTLGSLKMFDMKLLSGLTVKNVMCGLTTSVLLAKTVFQESIYAKNAPIPESF